MKQDIAGAGKRQDGGGEMPCCAPSNRAESRPFIPLSISRADDVERKQKPPLWADGSVKTENGLVTRVSSQLSKTDIWEHFLCRVSAFRTSCTVKPGLYAVGNPDRDSDVFVSANYKYSFDRLRQGLRGLDAWILVLDTKGINVWCAAGKGTFGTGELIKRIASTDLKKVVRHRKIILPQLGAPGVSGYDISKQTGFRVFYGPVCAKDISAYVTNGYKATKEMRTVRFNMKDRIVLTPMEINPAMRKFPLFAGIILLLFGLQPSGIIFLDAFRYGGPFLMLGLGSVFSGAFLTPLLLPFIPFRSFALKGWVAGLITAFLSINLFGLLNSQEMALIGSAYLFFPMAASYIALQFTGSTTFTCMSGVKKELRTAIPLYAVSLAISAGALIFFKLNQWGVL